MTSRTETLRRARDYLGNLWRREPEYPDCARLDPLAPVHRAIERRGAEIRELGECLAQITFYRVCLEGELLERRADLARMVYERRGLPAGKAEALCREKLAELELELEQARIDEGGARAKLVSFRESLSDLERDRRRSRAVIAAERLEARLEALAHAPDIAAAREAILLLAGHRELARSLAR